MNAPDEDRSPLATLLDLVVYAPIGLALDARTIVPNLVSRGRDQVSLLKVVTQLSLRKSEADARRRLQELSPKPTSDPASSPSPAQVAPDAASGADPVPGSDVATGEGDVGTSTAAEVDAPSSPDDVSEPSSLVTEAELPIPGYDSLSASQVVPRLGALDPTERDAVRRYEMAHRNRRTILNRITQLDAS